MKQSTGILTSLILACLVATRALPQDRKNAPARDTKETTTQTILEIFQGIENRNPQKPNLQRELELFDPNVEMNWPASLPYGGTSRGTTKPDRPSWGETWTPLQPTPAERKMDPRVVAANDNEVVVLYHQRGVSPAGDRYDGEVLGLYKIHEGKLTRAQMFYYDEVGAADFLSKAKSQVRGSK